MIHPDRNEQVGLRRRLQVGPDGTPVVVEDGGTIRLRVVGFEDVKADEQTIQAVRQAQRKEGFGKLQFDKRTMKVAKRPSAPVLADGTSPAVDSPGNKPDKL